MLKGIAISAFFLVMSVPEARMAEANYDQALSGTYQLDGKKLKKGQGVNFTILVNQVVTVAAHQPSSEQLDVTVTENQASATPPPYHSTTQFTQRDSELRLRQQQAENGDSRFNFFNMLSWILRIIYEEVKTLGEKKTKTVHTGKFTYHVNYAYHDKGYRQLVYTVRFYKLNAKGDPIYISVNIHLSEDGTQVQRIVVYIDAGNITYTLSRLEEERPIEENKPVVTTVTDEPDEAFQTPPESPDPPQNPTPNSQNTSQHFFTDTPETTMAVKFRIQLLGTN
ncbi:MAG: hypothetical protein ACR2PX_21810 [Endozoicomonas sp.]|uniref:hypothetical protein n=1 Tax=Endozoicomonas sp. TaxID=1892382 RepID=UPI003D9B4D35